MSSISAPGRFWIVRKPDSSGTIVAKFETTADEPSSIPYEILDSCISQTVSDRSELVSKSTDPSVLTEEEKEILNIPA